MELFWITLYIYIYIYMCVCVCVCVYIYIYVYIFLFIFPQIFFRVATTFNLFRFPKIFSCCPISRGSITTCMCHRGLLNDPLNNRLIMRNYRITHGCTGRYESRSSSRAKLRNAKPQPIASVCFCIALTKRGECIVKSKVRTHEAPRLSSSPPDLPLPLCYWSASGGILKVAVRRVRSGVRRDTCNRADQVCRICNSWHPHVTRDRFESTPDMRLVISQN